jgi:hypothetical protein
MPQSSAQKEFARALLKDVAPEEEEFLDAYEAALSKTGSGRKIGTGMGLPPEIAGAVGMIAVLVSRSVFDKLLEWGGQLAVEIAKKFVGYQRRQAQAVAARPRQITSRWRPDG